MLAMANKTAEAADVIDKLSERTGINREELQRWQYAAGQSGADIGTLTNGMKKLSDSMVNAGDGSKANVEAFAKLGISVDDLKTKTQSEIFDKVMSALADMPQGAERNALGNDLLGKSYTELLPLLNAGSKGMTDLKTRADELGLVMSEESVKANVVFGDSMADVKASISAVTMNITTGFLPIVQRVLDWTLAHMPEIKEITSTAFNVFGDAIQFVMDNSNWLIPVLGGLLGSIGALQVINVINGLMATWQASTIAQTIATGGLNGVMTLFNGILAANPIGVVVLAIGALIAAGIALYQNWETVSAYATTAWGYIRDFVGGIVEGIGTGFRKMVNGVIDGLNSMITTAANAVNSVTSLINKIPGVNIPKVSAPQLPSFDVGSRYIPYDMVAMLHEGEMVIPKSESPYANSNGNIMPHGGTANIYVELDGRTIVKAIGQPLIDEIRLRTGLKSL